MKIIGKFLYATIVILFIAMTITSLYAVLVTGFSVVMFFGEVIAFGVLGYVFELESDLDN